MNALVSSMQASHQKKMFELCGVDLQSQTAYELAVQGLIRPANSTTPIIYGMRCILFDRPEFIIEIHSINEDEAYLGNLIQEIGIQLHSVAHCSGIRCVRQGHFRLEDSLLRGGWSMQGIASNMTLCSKLLDKYPSMLHQNNIKLVDK